MIDFETITVVRDRQRPQRGGLSAKWFLTGTRKISLKLAHCMPRTLLGDKKIIRTIFEALSVKRTLPPHLDFTMTKAQAKPILLPPIYDVSAAPTPSNPTGNINKGLLLPSE